MKPFGLKIKCPYTGKILVLSLQLVLKTRWSEDETNLNAGRGDPCAGHDKLIELWAVLVKIKPSVLNENLGLAPPIGSEKLFFKNFNSYF